MSDFANKIEQEKKIIAKMITLYCRGKHNNRNGLCENCESLLEYATKRIEQCPFTETKTFCSGCKVHCYKKDKREEIRQVMRYAGPRMLIYDPILVIRHVIWGRKRQVFGDVKEDIK